MWLTRFAINRRVTISMFLLALVVLGLVGLSRMPWDLTPKVEVPVVSVTVPYPGANPEEIEQRIIKPLEDQISIINGVDEVQSLCQENVGTVVARFRYEIDVDVAAADVRDALDRARAQFPEGVKQPSVYKIDINAFPVVTVGLMSAQRPPRDLRKLVEDFVKPVLGQVPGVAAIAISGGEVREIQVLADRERLDAACLSIADLAQQLRLQNLDVPAGNIKEGVRDYAVRVLGQFHSVEEIRNLPINTPVGKMPLAELAEVRDTVAEPETIARVNGEPAVVLDVIKQSNANTVAVVEGVKRKLAELVGTEERPGSLPRDLKAVISYDGSKRVKEAIYDVRDALLYGALLAAIVVFLFLHNFRGTIIIALAIPTCILATFLPIGLGFGFTLNMMVMLGLSLAVGILIDDAIVVLENITRHLEIGEEPAVAAFNGRTEIGAAAVALTAVDTVVYIPVALMRGMVGRFFFSFGITVFVCVLFSLFVSFTLTPMLAAWWYQRIDRRRASPTGRGVFGHFFAAFDRGYEAMERAYMRLLRPAIRHPFLTFGIAFAALVLVMIGLAPHLGFEFMPHSDAGVVNINVEAGLGTRIEETDRIVRLIEQRLQDKQRYPEVTFVQATVGVGSGGRLGFGDTGGRFATITVTMTGRKERVRQHQRSDEELAAALRRDLADIPGVSFKVDVGEQMGGGLVAVQYNILAKDRSVRDRVAARLMERLKADGRFLNVDLSVKPGRPEIHVRIDRERASDLGLPVATIGAAVRTALAGDTQAKYREGGDEYDLRVEFREPDRVHVSDVANLYVGLSRNGQPVRLRDVATIEMSSGPSRVERYNRQPSVTLNASLIPGFPSQTARFVVEKLAREIALPGVSFAWTGTMRIQRESFGYIAQAMLLSVILIYIVTAALYNNVLEPFNILLTLPMALVGAIIGLYLSHMHISIVAMIGFIMLMGIVGKNAILVVDYTNTLRKRGLSRTEALLEAGPTRMRPVLMTTIACVFAMLPTAMALTEGSEMRQPMAIAVIFGLTLATLLSLVVVPATYCIFDSLGNFVTRRATTALRRLLRLDNDARPTEPSEEGGG